MPTPYKIQFIIDDKMAAAAMRRGISGLGKLETAAVRAATSIEKTLARSGNAAAASFANANAAANRMGSSTTAVFTRVNSAAAKANSAVIAAAGASVRAHKAAAQSATAAWVNPQVKGMVGLDKLRVQAVRFADVLRNRVEPAATAAWVSPQLKGMVGLDKLRVQAVKFGDELRRRAVPAATAAFANPQLRGMVGLDKLRVQAIKYGDKMRAQAGEQKAGFAESVIGATRFSAAMSGVGAALLGLEFGSKVIHNIGGAFEDARKKREEFTRGLLDTLSALRQVASVAGRMPNQQFARETASFNAQSGLTPEGGNRFNEAFLGRAQLTRGKMIADAEFDKFRLDAAKLTVGKGIQEDVAGDIFGGVLKTEDFQAKGQGAKEATARASTALKILDAGSGKMATLAPQLSELLGTLTKEDRLEGVFRNMGEAAVAVSVAAEHNPAEAATLVSRASQGMRDFGDKDKAEFFRRTGITDKDSYLEAVSKTNRVIGEDVAKGIPIDRAIANLGFNEIREVRGLKTNFLARDTVLAPQLANLAKGEAPGAADQAQADIAALQREQTSQDAISKAKIEEAKQRVGGRGATYAIAKQEAEAQLIREGIDTSVGGTLSRFALGATTAFQRDGRDIMIERRAIQNMRKEAGVDPSKGLSIGSGMGDAALAVQGHFGGDRSIEANQLAAMIENNRLVAENNRLLAAQVGGGRGGPAPAGVPPALGGAPPVNPRQP